MELPDRAAKGVVLRPVRLRNETLDVARPGDTIADPNRPHCADHACFRSDCVVCRRACANFEPYPVRKSKPVTRSFGYTDNITEEKLRALDPKFDDMGVDSPGYGVTFIVLRALWRLIWPFG